jgi:pimeloyl-ACP methyl ester carboxylesterase
LGNITRHRAALLLLAVVVTAVVVGGTVVARRATPAAGGRTRRAAAETAPAATAVAPRPTVAAGGPTTTVVAPDGLPVPPPLGWSSCGSGEQCSTLVVPLDYAQPSGPHIGIALERRPASDPSARIGSLVINPGGPGESGIGNFAKDLSVLPAGVLEQFDVVTFDPRGIAASEGIHCEGDDYDGPEPDPDPQTAAARQVLLTVDQDYASACADDVARDLEELRMALGGPLNYLGLSYGTLLGETYASLFPTHIRAMVLDGVIDPSLTTTQLADAQAVGFEQALGRFLAWCAAGNGCAWRPAGNPQTAFEALATRVREQPLVVGDRTVGPSEFYTGTFGSLYSSGFWPGLGQALAGVATGDGTAMLGLYDSYERVGDPTFDGDANNAVTCLDHPVPTDPASYPALAAAAAGVAPDFGPLFAWDGLTCAVWPVPRSDERVPAPVEAAGSPRILVEGTTGDPATPSAWAQSVAAHLANGVLLTRDGVDHVAIFTSSCVRDWDDTYLVTLRTPPPGTVCPS